MAVMTAIAVGGLILSGLATAAQVYQEAKARGEDEDRLREMMRDFEEMKPPQFDVSPLDPPEYIRDLPPPANFSMQQLEPTQIELLSQYEPDLPAFIAMEDPELLEKTDLAEEGMGAQLEALQRFRDIAETGEDPAMDAKLDLASRRSQQEAQSRTESILQDLARRGTLGSGIGAALQQEAALGSMSNLADQASMEAIASYENQLQAMRDAAGLGQDVFGQEMDIQSRNVDIMNRFNELATQREQSYLDRISDMKNQAKLRNLGEEQRVYEQNVTRGDQAAVRERDRYDDIAQQRRAEEMANIDYLNQLKSQGFADQQAVQGREDRLTQQDWDNQMNVLRSKHGLSGMQSQLAREGAQSVGRAGRALGETATQIGEYADDDDDKKKKKV